MSERRTRLIKWLGDPPAVNERDMWSVPDWKYENRRMIALPGRTQIVIEQTSVPGLSQSYKWDKDLPHFLLEVEEADALLILSAFPRIFRDVTGNPYPEHVRHFPIIVRTHPDGSKEVIPYDPLAPRESVQVSRIDH